MRVVLTGATGMIGSGTLIECLEHPDVESVLVIGRRSCGTSDPRVTEVLHDDFTDYEAVADQWAGCDAFLWCLGVSASGMSEDDYTRITDTFTMRAAEAFFASNPDGVFCYVSGEGADSSESTRIMWARVRGRLENKLLGLTGRAFVFRPGVIQPTKGVRSATALYQMAYNVVGPFFPLLNRLIPNRITSTDRLGIALIRVGRDGASGNHFTNQDINALAAAERVDMAGREAPAA